MSFRGTSIKPLALSSRRSTLAQKRNEVIIDLSIGLGLPVLVMALREYRNWISVYHLSDWQVDYVVQGHRYDIVENVGCTP